LPGVTPRGDGRRSGGPWINGGGWLTIGGVEVDLLYRDLGRVRSVIADARQGRFSMNYQPGHPHGFCSTIWMGEVATCRPFFDSLARFGWEVDFAIDNAEIAARRAERTHIAGCAYRALCCVAQVLFALNGRYLINEKGAVAEAATWPITIEGLAEAQNEIWRSIGEGELEGALRRLRSVSGSLRAILPPAGTQG
jgi:hypothetical protein